LEFYELLQKYFSYVYLSGQQIFSGSSIYPISSDEITSFSEFVVQFKGNQFYFSDTENSPRYFIAFASNIKLNSKEIQKSYLIDKSNIEISLFHNQIKELLKRTNGLETIVCDQNYQITDQNQHIHTIETLLNDKDNQITDKENHITQLKQHARNLEAIITDRNQQLQKFILFNQSLSNENNLIKQSLTYNLTTKFHKKIVERLLPQNTSRRKYYNLGLSGCRILINEGWDRFWWCYHERKIPHVLHSHNIIPIKQLEIEVQEPETLPKIQTKVSVIIPTKNAGPNFHFILEKIKNQKGVASVEIITVDSGSTDGTCDVAERFECRIFSIKPEEFNHGLTRNYGAEQATGEFIVFLVQDAIPIGDYWLFSMVNCLKSDADIAAVTCRQVPRSDADLFACYSMQYHYRTMEIYGDRVIGIKKEDFSKLTAVEKRKAVYLDDVCTCFRKNIYAYHRFKELNFAEDLDIGLRLLAEGYKIAFLCSSGVIHSHNRDAGYFFRRSFVESKTLPTILGGSHQNNRDEVKPIPDLIRELFWEYCLLVHVFSEPSLNIPDSMDDREFIDLIKKSLGSRGFKVAIPDADKTGFFDVISQVMRDCNISSAEESQTDNHFIDTLNAFFSHAKTHPVRYNTGELKDAVIKLFAIYAGARLGNLFIRHTKDETMKCIDQSLSMGV
jgi:glycosyltransferase involved in cell wall biosynthesis